jgi:hypothetical protein
VQIHWDEVVAILASPLIVFVIGLFARSVRAGLARIVPVAVFALTSCSHQPSPPVTVSQSETDLHLVQRVEAEARNSCSSDDGLRGIEWPYKSLPGGIVKYYNVPNAVSATVVPYSVFLANRSHEATSSDIILGPPAPSPAPPPTEENFSNMNAHWSQAARRPRRYVEFLPMTKSTNSIAGWIYGLTIV